MEIIYIEILQILHFFFFMVVLKKKKYLLIKEDKTK